MANTWDPVLGTPAYTNNENRIKTFVEQKGYGLNPDTSRVEKVLGLMTMNFQKTGSYFCPCKQSHPLNPASDVVCPCPELDTEIASQGRCTCKLIFRL
ncbi:MAG: hypothetical protein JW795_15550 [Chitinivibrionales bacterium]|nr:hypothetical protein [Chitinivibrionales bacterium]